ncbi:hypothetical protein [Bacillus sp. FJAT-45350]|uniref:hypothetical protein n=1 Tax=Bacillus sp. FJAT-45350 TaxID=2011014 RepID=UPI000BB7748D|nr:hypothetical protein [Bacillus sp. FJAT-45350]
MKKFLLASLLSVIFVSGCGDSENVTTEEKTDIETTDISNEVEATIADEVEVAEPENTGDNTEPIEVTNEKAEQTNGSSISSSDLIDEINFLADHESQGGLSITSEGKQFIQDNFNYFIDTNNFKEEIKSTANIVDVRELNKNARPYLSQLLSYSGYVVDIKEHHYEDDGVTLTYALISDDNLNYYTLYMFDSAEGIYEEDYVTFYGLPFGGYSFPNISGGHTNSQFFLASIIEK